MISTELRYSYLALELITYFPEVPETFKRDSQVKRVFLLEIRLFSHHLRRLLLGFKIK